jgi:hypothetical protein
MMDTIRKIVREFADESDDAMEFVTVSDVPLVELRRVLAVAEAAVKEEASLDHLMDSPTGATYQAHIDARAATRTAIRALRGATEVGS